MAKILSGKESERGTYTCEPKQERARLYILIYKGKMLPCLVYRRYIRKKRKKDETRIETEQVLCLISWAPDMTQQRTPGL